jgi:hypothetical protein
VESKVKPLCGCCTVKAHEPVLALGTQRHGKSSARCERGDIGEFLYSESGTSKLGGETWRPERLPVRRAKAEDSSVEAGCQEKSLHTGADVQGTASALNS